MFKYALITLIVSLNSFANFQSGDKPQLDLYHQTQKVLKESSENHVDESELEVLMNMVQDRHADVYESVQIINLAFNIDSVSCDNEVVMQIVNSLNTTPQFRFNYGLDFYCDEEAKVEGVRQIIQSREI